jgi:hypothetical protein
VKTALPNGWFYTQIGSRRQLKMELALEEEHDLARRLAKGEEAVGSAQPGVAVPLKARVERN